MVRASSFLEPAFSSAIYKKQQLCRFHCKSVLHTLYYFLSVSESLECRSLGSLARIGASAFLPLLLSLIRLLLYPHFDQNAIPIKQQESCSLFLHDIPACYNGLRSPYRPLSATEDGDQSRRIPYLSEAWTFWPRKEAAGVADAMIKARSNVRL